MLVSKVQGLSPFNSVLWSSEQSVISVNDVKDDEDEEEREKKDKDGNQPVYIQSTVVFYIIIFNPYNTAIEIIISLLYR